MATTGVQGFPTSGTPIMDGDGNINVVWLRFFISLWTRTGGTIEKNQTTVFGLTGNITLSQFVDGGLAPINSPVFTGIPTAPNPSTTSNDNQIATTGFVIAHRTVPTTPTPTVDPGSYPIIPLTATTSPFTYNPPMSGNILISGGTVSSVTLTRAAVNLGHPITKISLTKTTFPPNAPVGTVVGLISVTATSVGPIALSVTGPDAADFIVVGNELRVNVTGLTGTYNISITATASLVVTGTPHPTGMTSGSLRLTDFDLVTITFSVAPTLVFFPS